MPFDFEPTTMGFAFDVGEFDLDLPTGKHFTGPFPHDDDPALQPPFLIVGGFLRLSLGGIPRSPIGEHPLLRVCVVGVCFVNQSYSIVPKSLSGESCLAGELPLLHHDTPQFVTCIRAGANDTGVCI